jgi:Fe2+ or Zn2+ uptake regulation protein
MWAVQNTSVDCGLKTEHHTHVTEKYCGVFTPCKNCNIETRSRDYATVDEAVFSSCRAEICRVVPSRASPRPAMLVTRRHCKRLNDARVGKGHVTS